MRISIESSLLNHHRRSGLLTYTEGLVNGLAKVDRENDYSLAYYSLRRRASQMPGPESRNFKKIVLKVPDLQFWGRQALIDKIVLPAFLRREKSKIFHRTSGYTMPDVNGIFTVLTIHDLRTLTIGDKRWMQNIAKYQRTISRVDMCVVVSECTKKDLIKHFGLTGKKIRVVYLGADERFRPSGPSQIEKVKIKYGIREPFFLSIGSVPRKNINGIIRGFAASHCKDKYLLVLSCNQDVAKYQSLSEALGAGNRVLILDNLSDDEVVALYSGCHCFLFPSLYEGFGLPILEAMRCGAPVITSNLSSCPEVAGDAALLVDPNNTDEISDAINQVCGNGGLRKALVNKGFERAKLFSWDKFAREMKDIYALA